jgi:HEAT repeat protein
MDYTKGKIERGFVAAGDELLYAKRNNDELIELLKSRIAGERTIAVRLLGGRTPDSSEFLFAALEAEQKLYPKLEICRALAGFGNYAINGLINRLGKIGDNQHLNISLEPFRKNSYPLPRDIAARILIRIGSPALPALCEVLERGDSSKISEAIDTIGFICFAGENDNYLEPLMICYSNYSSSDLLRWKIIRALSAFPASRSFLEAQLIIEVIMPIKQEIERSIRLISRKIGG